VAAEAGLTAHAGAAFDRLFPKDARILIAVSGGPDSMTLLALLADWVTVRPHVRLFASTVDHGLRPEAAAEAKLCAHTAKILGVPHRTLRWDGDKPATGIQEAARKVRYALLAKEARRVDATHIATAHHADDQAETILMRLAAGSSITGLAGMREARGHDGIMLVRPLLGFRKSELQAFCATRGLAAVDDPSNANPRFGRVRTRRMLQLLAAEGLTAERLIRLGRRAASADNALNVIAAEHLEAAVDRRTDCLLRLDWSRLSNAPTEIRLRALGSALAGIAQSNSSSPMLEALERLLDNIDAAFAAGRRLRRTLAGRMVTLMTDGAMTVAPAPPRRTR
jgi:tRNA(Ile)-lysidine synthase